MKLLANKVHIQGVEVLLADKDDTSTYVGIVVLVYALALSASNTSIPCM